MPEGGIGDGADSFLFTILPLKSLNLKYLNSFKLYPSWSQKSILKTINKMAVVELLKIREEIDSFIETLEILKDEELLRDIEEAKKDIEEGNVISFDDLVKELGLEDELWASFFREI